MVLLFPTMRHAVKKKKPISSEVVKFSLNRNWAFHSNSNALLSFLGLVIRIFFKSNMILMENRKTIDQLGEIASLAPCRTTAV